MYLLSSAQYEGNDVLNSRDESDKGVETKIIRRIGQNVEDEKRGRTRTTRSGRILVINASE